MAKLFTDSKNPQAYKALVAAAYAEFKVETVTVNVNEWSDLKQKSPYGKVPVLETSEATLNEANAIARYIARNSKGYALYGKSASEAGLIENWIDFAANEVEFPGGVWTLPIQGKIPENPDATGRAKADIRKALETVDKHMSTRTFLVGHRLTLADVVVSMSFLTLYELVLDESFRKQFVNANRWFKTCINQPQFKSVLGEVQLSVKMAVAKESAPREVKKEQPKKEEKKEQPKKEEKKEQPKKEEKKEQPKKEQPKKEEEEDELEEKKEKKKNPLDDLPASKFVMDDWKRFYSNNETSDSIKYFWENYDPAGYSVWFGEYKDPEQNTKLFMTLNLVNGFIQRLEYLRKYGFGSIVLFGEEPRLEIGGCFVVRGNEIPAEMSECPDFESYDWRRGDLSKSEDKKLLEGYWAWDPEIGGRKFNQGKIFK